MKSVRHFSHMLSHYKWPGFTLERANESFLIQLLDSKVNPPLSNIA